MYANPRFGELDSQKPRNTIQPILTNGFKATVPGWRRNVVRLRIMKLRGMFSLTYFQHAVISWRWDQALGTYLISFWTSMIAFARASCRVSRAISTARRAASVPSLD